MLNPLLPAEHGRIKAGTYMHADERLSESGRHMKNKVVCNARTYTYVHVYFVYVCVFVCVCVCELCVFMCYVCVCVCVCVWHEGV